MHLAPSHGSCLAALRSPSAPSATPRRQRTPPRVATRAAGLCALVVGGTGRVGGSSTRWLKKLAKENQMELELSVGGRRRENYESFKERWTEGADVPNFVEIDHSNEASINRALTMKPWNLILHTAGPFQRVKEPRILKEALRLRLPYVDVCDDTDLCKVAKCLAESAASDGVPAVVSAGIWPGVSALMVCEAHERLGDIEDLTMSFYTSGTGGAGATIVSATFLLLAEPPLNYKDGHAVRAEAWGNRRKVDFGAGVGEQPVHLLDEPEVYTCHEHLQIPNVAAFLSLDSMCELGCASRSCHDVVNSESCYEVLMNEVKSSGLDQRWERHVRHKVTMGESESSSSSADTPEGQASKLASKEQSFENLPEVPNHLVKELRTFLCKQERRIKAKAEEKEVNERWDVITDVVRYCMLVIGWFWFSAEVMDMACLEGGGPWQVVKAVSSPCLFIFILESDRNHFWWQVAAGMVAAVLLLDLLFS